MVHDYMNSLLLFHKIKLENLIEDTYSPFPYEQQIKATRI